MIHWQFTVHSLPCSFGHILCRQTLNCWKYQSETFSLPVWVCVGMGVRVRVCVCVCVCVCCVCVSVHAMTSSQQILHHLHDNTVQDQFCKVSSS